ncbi:potassium channel family protein [Demequina sp. SO4-18]|uniref:potassium channel family protein n=1 Tax=Demequina sp. SO4-18 TaxID=3401026 RepID=UPI003B5A03EF
MTAATIGGVLLVAATGVDLALTLLHPTRSGYLSRVAMSVTWRFARTAATRLRRNAIVGYAGPAIMLVQISSWVLGLWLGFALIYAGQLDHLGYMPPHDGSDVSFVDAVYFSGVSLSTVGFGELVAENDALRLISAVQAASGLAVFGAAISYLLTVYPLVSETRTIARLLTSAQDHKGAAELVVHGGQSRLQALQRDLIQLDESTQRFPILYYFHANDTSASLGSAMRGASLVTMQLQFGLAAQAAPYGHWYGQVLGRTLTRVTEHFSERFHPGADAAAGSQSTAEQVERALVAIRDSAAEVTGVRAEDEADREALARLLDHTNAFLAELERQHLHSHERI